MYLSKQADINNMETIDGIYVVMDYVKHTLSDALYNTEEVFTREQAIIIVYNILCAVKYLHSANVIHRDLKPANILVTEDLQVKICDFGLARGLEMQCEANRKRRFSFSCFTRHYRPPEVILHVKSYDEKADVWSLGCIFSEVFQKTV